MPKSDGKGGRKGKAPANNKPKKMASEDLFRSDSDESDDPTPDMIEVDGWRYMPSTISSFSAYKREFDSLTLLLVEKFIGLVGIKDMFAAEYNFIK